VLSYLNTLERSSSSSTSALLDALRPLQDYGFSADEAMMLGMGRFPVGGQAYFSDDFHDPRLTPTPHLHQGNDIFAAFGTPVRSPANGVLQYAVEPVGGSSAYVTEPDGTYYYMAHLQGFTPGLASGTSVTVGQVVGFNGDTGNAKGGAPHVHFEIHPGGAGAVNPKPILDRWLADALAAVPALMAPYQQDGSRPLTALGLARHLDRGMLAGPSEPLSAAPELDTEDPTAQILAEALVGPLTPSPLRIPSDFSAQLRR
jgi:hypothetical protein